MLTLAEFSAAKGFSAEQLAAYGVRQGSRGVEIPYYDLDGTEWPRVRIRTAIAAKEGSAWSEGDAALIPYGLQRPVAWDKQYAFIVEGETDCWALWVAGKPSIGVPGASNAKCLKIDHVAGATSLYVIREPDTAGARFTHRVADRLYSQGFEGSIFEVALESAKDPHDLWTRDPANFESHLREAMQSRLLIKRQIVDKKDTGMRSLKSILSKPRKKVEYLIDGLLPKGGIMLTAAKPKAGKSELTRNAARAVALGVPFLGRDVMQGNVVWVRMEEPFEHFIDNIVAMGGEEFVDRLFVNEDTPPTDTIRWLEDVISEFNPILIVIDTWAKFTRVEDINSYSKVNLANEALMRISRDRGIAQIWIHHSNKGEGKGGAAVLGSSALFAACDTLLTIECYPNDARAVSTTQRVGESMPETLIVMDPETKLITLAGGKLGIRNGQIEQRILEIISAEPGILKTDIVARTQARKADVLAALVALEERGVIVKDADGVRGDPHRYSIVIRNGKSNSGTESTIGGNRIGSPREQNRPVSGTESGHLGNGIDHPREQCSDSVPADRENSASDTRNSIPFPVTTPPYGGECGYDSGTQLFRHTNSDIGRSHDGIKFGNTGFSPILVSPNLPVSSDARTDASADDSRQTPLIANGGGA